MSTLQARRLAGAALVSGESMFKGPHSQIVQLSPSTLAKLKEMQEIAREKAAEKARDAAAAKAAAEAAQQQAIWDALPASLDFRTNQITFSNGCPVGGWAEIRLYKNGNYEFWGHFHDSGAPSYDAGIAWVIVDNEGTGFSFEAKVHLNGTFESGSRDGDWHQTGNNPQIHAHWAALCAGSHWKWSANVNWDWGILLKQVEDGLKAAGTIVAGVVAVVALV
ncbi:hypothetical protein [Paraburkholderia sp. J94]|uniref:hypothetical protein n=1 Tax=Paraburkholderia sp. J94 TaxID=2805441 RepID=UPI002AB0ADAA|nr:hypothetical protein [Paraburkholderia sp. J94]